ncbi:hypothetical protein GN956_G5882 [Arapaima gigas]
MLRVFGSIAAFRTGAAAEAGPEPIQRGYKGRDRGAGLKVSRRVGLLDAALLLQPRRGSSFHVFNLLRQGRSQRAERPPTPTRLIKPQVIMPRSFLIKKYFSSRKPNYSELESQTGSFPAGVPAKHPVALQPPGGGGLSAACSSTGLAWDIGLLPALYTPAATAAPSAAGPLNLSGSQTCSSEEDEGRTSDPPSPDPAERYRCQHCGKSYGGAAALSRHQLSRCGKGKAAARATCTIFRCKQCSKEYNSLGALKMHIRSHTLPCVCPTCGKAFSRPWLLRGHIRTHTGERPFSCPHCNRAFADRSNLRAHLQTHSEVKKYQCSTCSRTFSRMSLLHKHTVSGCCPPST